MTAVYKRELRSYLTSMIGYLFMFYPALNRYLFFSLSADIRIPEI